MKHIHIEYKNAIALPTPALHCCPMTFDEPIRYCWRCGAPMRQGVPPDDTRERAICTRCQKVHYRNPLPVTCTLPCTADGRVLLCLRAIEPRLGYWTLPGGFMEAGETLRDSAARETREEAGAEFELGECIALLSVPRISQIHSFHLARLTSETFAPGSETQQARLFAEAEIPWEQLAFNTVRATLQHYFACRRAGRFTLLEESIA